MKMLQIKHFCFIIERYGGGKVVTYKKLWKLLIDRDLKKKDLCEMANVSPASLTKMKNNASVTTDVISRICEALECDTSDIMEYVEEKNKFNTNMEEDNE